VSLGQARPSLVAACKAPTGVQSACEGAAHCYVTCHWGSALVQLKSYLHKEVLPSFRCRRIHTKMPKLYYFQAPNFTINPDSHTAPALGSIFYSLDHLTAPLNQQNIPYIPPELTNQSASENFDESVDRGFAGSVGINATIAQGIAGTATAVYAFAKDKKNVYRCEELETVEFEPNQQFINDSITASKNVQDTISNALIGQKRVYMITGLKIATGFSTSTSKGTQHGPVLNIGVDATAFGVPEEAGPQMELSTNSARTVSQGRTLNKIVFAYRVVKIRLKRDGQAKWKHLDGGKYSVEDDDSDEEDEPYALETLDEADVQKEFPEATAVELVNVDATQE
jgi:hypothetical protein